MQSLRRKNMITSMLNLPMEKYYVTTNDPRRFGAWLWSEDGCHTVLKTMGPEPLTDDFDADYISEKAVSKRVTVKQFIMDNKIVVGVGNIYANESLFTAGILPTRGAGTLSLNEWQKLVKEIKVLSTAIAQGGTTLKDFAQADGKPGYFAQKAPSLWKRGTSVPLLCSPCKGAENRSKKHIFASIVRGSGFYRYTFALLCSALATTSGTKLLTSPP